MSEEYDATSISFTNTQILSLTSLSSNMFSCFKNPSSRESNQSEEEEGFFLRNGALVLQHLITSFNGKTNPIKTFSNKELNQATNNFHFQGLLQDDLNYELYKGITRENCLISVKKFVPSSRFCNDNSLQWFTNEVAVASHMSTHKNVLTFLGCCLETDVPTLVYEYAENGSLSNHIFGSGQLLKWTTRLRIATEVANAITYLHNGTSKVIIHREIRSKNIFLDQDFVAKLFEFNFSIPLPLGKDHVDAEAIGTWGYISPESILTGRFTEKSDVYSFGAVLFEMLTGKTARESLHVYIGNVVSRSSSSLELADDSKVHVESGNVSPESIDHEIKDMDLCIDELRDSTDSDIGVWSKMDKRNESYLKANVLKQGSEKQIAECAELALMCLKMDPVRRPTMMEVAKALRLIQRL